MVSEKPNLKNVKIHGFALWISYVETVRYFSNLIRLVDTAEHGLCYIQNLHSWLSE